MQQPPSILKEPSTHHEQPSPKPRKMSRPRIQLPSLQIPTPAAPMPTIHTSSPPQMASPYGMWVPNPMTHPMTPVGGIPMQGVGATGLPIGLAGNMGRFTFYPSKAGEFMLNQFAGFKDFTMNTAKSGLSHGEKTAFWLHGKVSSWSKRWFTHIFLFLVIFAYSLLGALIFVAVEGTHEEKYRDQIREKREAFLVELHDLAKNRTLVYSPKWTNFAHEKLSVFETELRGHIKRGEDDAKPEKVWTYWNAVFYCGTIYTTIGYGHISPVTTTGRAVTILYAIIGIPLFLILLADFGKLFTRSIKFAWSFVRRLFYTGSCRKVRRTQPVQDVMKGVQMVYDLATFRRPSQMYAPNPEGGEEAGVPLKQPPITAAHLNPNLAAYPQAPYRNWPQAAGSPLPGTEGTDTPATPAPSAFEVDDEFNLPISVAITILLIYMFVGATIYYMWEDWGFFESFYFVFVSMSTIGFGDFVPQHPMYMMASIVYLVFGLALTSMCINVVQEKLSDTFRQASAKIGATIGLRLAEEESKAAAEAERAKNSAEVQDPAKTEQGNNTSNNAIS